MKKIRLILPAAAIALAAIGVFGTNASAADEPQSINVSLNGGNCNIDGTCNTSGTVQCRSGSTDLDRVTTDCPDYTANGQFTAS